MSHRPVCKPVSLAAGIALAFVFMFARGARAEEFYYMMVFGSQRVPPQASYSHTFATFVKATGQGPCAESYALESVTISWLPRVLDIRLFALLPELGQNLDLYATIRWALNTGQRVSMWGPYRIDQDLYCRAVRQVRLLESGTVQYKAVDAGWPGTVASNCIHAVSSIEGGRILRVLSINHGETASFYVTLRLSPWILDGRRKHEWVSARLGIDAYPIIHRELENPHSGVVQWALRAPFRASEALVP
jgi:hypothetical protein